MLDRLDDVASFVVERLHDNRTPEQIVCWLKSGAEQLRAISHEAICTRIYGRSQRRARLWRRLPRKKGNRGFRPAGTPRIAIKDRRSIHDRPEAVEDRAEGGHWEGDLLICKKTRPAPVLTERKSRFTIAAKVNGKNPEKRATAIMRIFRRLDPALRRSATFDNDTAFARHGSLRQALLQQLGLDITISFRRGVALQS